MKKNKMMRAASGLLVATLLTTSVISGTFAKYTTSSGGSDSARVAKWGFEDTSSITLNDLFKNAYDSDSHETVKSADGEDVIAPGTTNSASFAFNYNEENAAPEVAYTFTVSTEGSTIAKDIKDNTNIQWKLDNGNWGTWDDLLAAIEALDGDKVQYEAGELPTGFDTTTEHTVSWQWVFYTTDEADATDTAMGNKDMAALDEVELHITITATQVD